MKPIVQTAACDICGLVRGVGSHVECAKKRQAMYAAAKRPKPGKKKDDGYSNYDPTGGKR